MRLASSKQQASSSAGPFLGPKAAGVPKSKKKLHVIRDGISQLSRQQVFFLVGPPPVGNGDLVVFRPVLALGMYRNSGPPCNFPVLGALLRKQSGRPKSLSPKLRNFFTFSVLADRTPGDWKSRNAVFLRPFWPRTALGTIPDSVVTFFPHKSPPSSGRLCFRAFCLGPEFL